jgi:hypothetical protein
MNVKQQTLGKETTEQNKAKLDSLKRMRKINEGSRGVIVDL